jgi:dTDP-4-dehydrorhamnose reductase
MSKTNILITGAAGQLGSEFNFLSELPSSNNFNFFFVTRNEFDIENIQLLTDFCNQNEISVIVNCAAYTAVDKAESEFELADATNHLLVKNIAEIAKNKNIKLIHISTDYVFDGRNNRPYKESDKPNPQGIYGQTKLDGERAMQRINPEHSIIIRTSWVYSEFGNNFVKTMVRLASERDEISVVADQIGTPTNARDLARSILEIIPQLESKINGAVEIFHFTNAGVCSWYDFAKAIFDLKAIKCKVTPISTSLYPTVAIRPQYSVMDKSKILETFNLDDRYWREALADIEICMEVLL